MGFWDITASALIGPMMNLGGSQLNAWQQFKRQKELMALQLGNQQILNKQGQELQMDMWNKTNYGAQVEQLKAAGLNPSLIYGKGGQGGVTGSQGGGSAASGNAAAAQLMDLNVWKNQAELDLLKSQARLNNVEADKKSGVDTEKTSTEIDFLKSQIQSNDAKIALDKAQTIGIEIDNKLKNATFETRADIAKEELKLYRENVKRAVIENGIKEGQAEALITQENQKVALNYLDLQLKDKQINLTEEQIKSIKETVSQGWAKIDNEKKALTQGDRKLELHERETIVKEKTQVVEKAFKEFQERHPSTSQVAGKALNFTIGGIQEMLNHPWRY
jgi:hypothetical protein